MTKYKKLLISIILNFIFAFKAYAICPVCTAAVAAGVGLSRWLKIDDTITGIWIGALIVSLIMWMISWLERKKFRFEGDLPLITIAFYALVLLPLYFTEILGHPLNKLWGIDRLILGIIFGSILFFAGAVGYLYLKKKNNNRAYFPAQKIVMTVAPIIILTVILLLIMR